MNTYLTKSISYSPLSAAPTVADVAKFVGLSQKQIKSCVLHRKSVDARKKSDVKFVCSYVIETDGFPKNCAPHAIPKNVLETAQWLCRRSVVVVGSGPAGLFAALYLLKSGAKVLLLERGADVVERKAAVDEFFAGGKFRPDVNVQFGLGGAGTFSDGKLTSGISSPLTRTVFEQFVKSGAPDEIMYSATPHVGTDKLVGVVANMRDEIFSLGGKILFNTKLTNLQTGGGAICGVVAESAGKTLVFPCDDVVLAVGHSARDTFRSLYEQGVEMRFKPFAVGVRVEHDRAFISRAQYGKLAETHRDFASANYKMAANFDDGRSCYTFCMCPGGTVVAANSTENSVVVNGMSNFDRMADFSNSALVVNVSESDVGSGVFGGVEFQEKLERDCFLFGGGDYVAPAQNVVDFLAHRPSDVISSNCSYPRGVRPSNLWDVLPQFVCQTLEKGLVEFGKKISGFDRCGTLIAVESRTSSPVKVLRDADSLQSVSFSGLYPCGEGAGYAGGIVSAAVDGLRVAIKIVEKC